MQEEMVLSVYKLLASCSFLTFKLFLPASQRLGHKLVSHWGSCWEGDVSYLSDLNLCWGGDVCLSFRLGSCWEGGVCLIFRKKT